MRVPFVDLSVPDPERRSELLAAIGAVLERGDFILGREVAEFEDEFAAFCGARYAVGVSSGTSALVLALRAVDVGPGDEVITVANSFLSTVSSIMLKRQLGAYLNAIDRPSRSALAPTDGSRPLPRKSASQSPRRSSIDSGGRRISVSITRAPRAFPRLAHRQERRPARRAGCAHQCHGRRVQAVAARSSRGADRPDYATAELG